LDALAAGKNNVFGNEVVSDGIEVKGEGEGEGGLGSKGEGEGWGEEKVEK